MMHFNIQPVKGVEDRVEEYYAEHSHYHDGDAGLDLFCLAEQTIPARATSVKIPLGIHVENSPNTSGYYLYPRSSMGSKTPLRLSNSIGIIDAGYRGELMAIVDNVSDTDFTIKPGQRYFQLCSPTLAPVTFKVVSALSQTTRGVGGFGSTGV